MFYAVWAIFLLVTGMLLAVVVKKAETLKSKYSAMSTVHSASGAGLVESNAFVKNTTI